MTNQHETNKQAQLYAMLQEAKTVEALGLVLHEIEVARPQLDWTQAWFLTRSVFELAPELSESNTDALATFAIESLIPLCQRSYGTGDDEEGTQGIERYRVRQFLFDWLSGLSTEQMFLVRNRIISYLIRSLKTNPTKDCLWTLSTIGYRSDEIVDQLWLLVESNVMLADTALSTLISLGPSKRDKDRILQIASMRLKDGITGSTVQLVVQELVGPDQIEMAEKLLANMASESPDRKNSDESIVVSVVTRALDRCEIESAANDRLWSFLRNHFKAINMSGDYGYRCSSSQVAQDYAVWFLEGMCGKGSESGNYILLSRLRELVKPTHLAHWLTIASPKMKERLTTIVATNTNNSGDYHTVDQSLKKEALEMLLSLGYTDFQSIIHSAVLEETSAYASAEMSEVLACLQYENLPASILDSIVACESIDSNENRHLFRQRGLEELARSSGSRPAFDAMLQFGFTHDGNVLLSTIAAIVDLAVTRIRAGDLDVIARIVDVATIADEKHHRDAAISVFCALAHNDFVPLDYMNLLWAFASDTKLDGYSRGESLVAIGRTSFPEASRWKDEVLEIAKTGEKRVSWQAWEAILRRGWLTDSSETILWEYLGVQSNDDALRLDDAQSVEGWQAYLLGVLFGRDQDRYEACVIDCIESGQTEAVFQLSTSLKQVGKDCSLRIVEALRSRVTASNTQWMSDSGLFELLASISDTALLDLARKSDWHDWMTEGKYSFCEAIRDSYKDLVAKNDSVADILVEFMTDPAFQVRRSAYRACSEYSHERLATTCEAWSQLDDIELRKRAAEALSWLPMQYSDAELERFGFSEDREPTVRQAWKNTLLDRRRRSWASEYLDRVLNNCGGENDAIAENHRYARAIACIGDDDCVRKLQSRLADKQLSPNGRAWLRKTVKETKKQWKETTSKWPEPWSDERDSIETVDGELVFAEDHRVAVKVTLWRQQSRSQTELYSWGGTALDQSGGLPQMINDRAMTLELPGREPVEVVCNQRNWFSFKPTQLAFFGNVAYPRSSHK